MNNKWVPVLTDTLTHMRELALENSRVHVPRSAEVAERKQNTMHIFQSPHSHHACV